VSNGKLALGHRLRCGTAPTFAGYLCRPSTVEAVRQRYIVQASEVLCTVHSTFQLERLTSDARIVKPPSQFTFNVRVMGTLAVVAPEV
jgi:hypothetical protein